MSFENFDKKIKEAAEHHSSQDHEQAWEKMETLLNKHLPQKKRDNRRFLFLLFGILLLGGGAYIFVKKPFGSGNTISITEKKPAATQDNSTNTKTTTAPEQESINNTLITEPSEQAPVNKIEPASQNEKKSGISSPNSENKPFVIAKSAVKDPPEQNIPVITKSEKKQEALVNDNQKQQADPNRVTEDGKKDVAGKSEPAIDTKSENNPQQTQVSATKNNKTDTKAKGKRSFAANIAFTLSAGPDLSFVEINDAGQLRLAYGAGLSIPVSKHVAIRTGLLVTRKIYDAGPEDYHPTSPNFWSYYPNLKQIDADCKIYDVPLVVDYNFGKKSNWFASAGVSNLFMKRETYNYTYKPPTSPQYVSYSHTYNNENRHYFSVLNLSGGYTQKISNAVSLRAEPYAKLPLSGIGHGNIKLGGGGLLLTASIKPFAVKQDHKK